MNKLFLFTCLFYLISINLSGQNVGHFYGSEDGSDSNVLKLGKRTSTSQTPHFYLRTMDGGGATFTIHSTRWGGQYLWSRESSGGDDKKIAYLDGNGSNSYFQLFNNSQAIKVQIHTNGNSYFGSPGNFGIGTETPATKLHLFGGGNSYPQLRIHENGGYNSLDIGHDGSNSIFKTNEGNFLFENGNVGIGTSTTGSHKLAVDGTIGAREIRVESGTWSDFVFDSNYTLRNLEELEKFINENKHLPEIPSEEEIIQNGFELGKMDAKLLQKIEELTLYILELNKKIEFQQSQIENLQNHRNH